MYILARSNLTLHQINDAQRQCVIGEFLNQSTEFGGVVFNMSDTIHEVSREDLISNLSLQFGKR